MMKWLRLFFLVGIVAVVGCSKGPSASERKVEDAGEAKVDRAQETKALKGGAAPSPSPSATK